jgi:hypothetical protein
LADADWQLQGRIRKPDANSNSHPNANSDSHPDADSDADSDTHTFSNRYANANSCTPIQSGSYSSIIESNQPIVD